MIETMSQFAQTAPWFVPLLSVAVTEGCNRKRAQWGGTGGSVAMWVPCRLVFLQCFFLRHEWVALLSTPSSDNLEKNKQAKVSLILRSRTGKHHVIATFIAKYLHCEVCEKQINEVCSLWNQRQTVAPFSWIDCISVHIGLLTCTIANWTILSSEIPHISDFWNHN